MGDQPIDGEALAALYEQAAAVRDEAKHVSRRARLLTQIAAELESMAARHLESEGRQKDGEDEDTGLEGT